MNVVDVNRSRKINLPIILVPILMLLFTLIGINQKVDAAAWISEPDSIEFSPVVTSSTRYGGSTGGRVHPGGDAHWEGHTFKGFMIDRPVTTTYKNVGRYNGSIVDMKIKVSNMKNFTRLNMNVNAPGFIMSLKDVSKQTWNRPPGYPTNKPVTKPQGPMASADVEIWFTNSSGTKINFGSDDIAMAFMELEPTWFYGSNRNNPIVSLDQRVVVDGSSVNVKYGTNFTNPGIIDKNLVKSNIFTSQAGTVVPSRYYKGQNFLNEYDQSSGVLAYSNKGNNSLKLKFTGRSGIADLILFNGKTVTNSKVIPQPKPVKEQKKNGGSWTKSEVELDNFKQPFEYKITQKILYDKKRGGKGFKIEDNVPNNVQIDSVVASSPGNWTVTTSGQKITMTAKTDIFAAQDTYSFIVKGHIKSNMVNTTTYFDNYATSTPPKGSAGGGRSNTVRIKVPKRTLKINYLDFDHPERQIKPSETIPNIPASQEYRFTPPKTITYNNRPYNYVKGVNDGTEITPTVVVDKSSTDTTYNFYYRTKWDANVIHQKEGTNPAVGTRPDLDKGPLLKQTTEKVYYKTNDGKRINSFTGTIHQPYLQRGLYTSDWMGWFPVETSKKQNVVEDDNQVIRLNYKNFYYDFAVDYIMITSNKASEKKFPFEYRWRLTGLPTENWVNLSQNTQEARAEADQVWQYYLAHKNRMIMNTQIREPKAGSRLLYRDTEPLTAEDRGKDNFIMARKDINIEMRSTIEKLDWKPDSKIEFDFRFSLQPTSIFGTHRKEPELVVPMWITTASERKFTNSDLKGDKLVYKYPVRTLYEGKTDKIHPYYEQLNVSIPTNVDNKSGYYDGKKIIVDYYNEVGSLVNKDRTNFTTTMITPSKFLEDYKTKQKHKVNVANNKMLLENKKAMGDKINGIPRIEGVTPWRGITIRDEIKYPDTYAELRTGDLYLKEDLSGVAEAKGFVKGEARLYAPIWADVKKYPLHYKSEDMNAKVNKIGSNELTYDFTRNFNVFAQMYSDDKSNTKKIDELYVQPVFADENYDKMGDLTPAGKKWITSVTTQHGKQ